MLIPKAGHPGKFRPLGIPTVKDRVIQAAVKNIVEPIFEADFYPTSYGFRPGRSVHGAIAHLQGADETARQQALEEMLENGFAYQWAIEADIKGCFDNIDHHALMVRVRRRVGDAKLESAGPGIPEGRRPVRGAVPAHATAGTPQGGILLPAAGQHRAERHRGTVRATRLAARDGTRRSHEGRPSEPRTRSQRRLLVERTRTAPTTSDVGRPVFMPIRYADDFIVLVARPTARSRRESRARVAEAEKAALAKEPRARASAWSSPRRRRSSPR